jgi:hypothetical protein
MSNAKVQVSNHCQMNKCQKFFLDIWTLDFL